jgi:hypothetical protein
MKNMELVNLLGQVVKVPKPRIRREGGIWTVPLPANVPPSQVQQYLKAVYAAQQLNIGMRINVA